MSDARASPSALRDYRGQEKVKRVDKQNVQFQHFPEDLKLILKQKLIPQNGAHIFTHRHAQ